MEIELYSDPVCPWCYIGTRRLERARAMRPDVPVRIRWRAFQLNPWMPPEGMSRTDYLAAKFGAADATRAYENIRRIGVGEDIVFNFDAIERAPNTVDAHRLIRWAGQAEPTRGEAVMADALFNAYFQEARDIGLKPVLIDIADSVGFDGDAAARLLAGDEDKEAVRAEDANARQMGIQGVPCFIIDKRYAVSGAQEPEYFMPLFDLAGQMAEPR